MYVYIYRYTYIHTHTYIYTQIYMYIYIQLSIYIAISIYTGVPRPVRRQGVTSLLPRMHTPAMCPVRAPPRRRVESRDQPHHMPCAAPQPAIQIQERTYLPTCVFVCLCICICIYFGLTLNPKSWFARSVTSQAIRGATT